MDDGAAEVDADGVGFDDVAVLLLVAFAPADGVFASDDDDGVAAVEGFGGVFSEFEFRFDEVAGGVLVLGPSSCPVLAGVLEYPEFGDRVLPAWTTVGSATCRR